MDNKFFDHIVKSKLENLTSDDTPRWDLFQKKKSVHDGMRADTAFDNNIRRTISEYTQPYNPNHWSILKARLERIYRLRKALYSVKVYEILAVLLLFYSVGSNYDYIFSKKDNSNIISSQPIALSIDQDVNSEIKNTVYTPSEVSDAAISNSTENNNTVANTAVNTTAVNLMSTATSESITNTNKVIRSRISSNSTTQNVTNNNSNNGIGNNNVTTYNPVSASNNNTLNAIIAKGAEEASDMITTNASVNHIIDLESIISITSTIKNNELEPLLIPDNFGIKPVNNITRDGKWLQVAASFDNNLITTPYNEIYNLGGPESGEMFGYSLSGLFSIQKGKLEYETGMTYSVYNKPIAFRRPWENNRGDVFMYSLTNINYDILSVPLRVKYHFANTSDWSLYVTGGLSPEFIVNTGYSEKNEKMNINVPAPQGSADIKPELTESPFRSESNFHNGLFEQGSFQENFMLRAQIGAGMQRNITSTLTAFIAGDYYTSLLNTTYGPTDDSINKFSITFGIKERF